MPTFNGTNGDDTLVGTEGDDIFRGGRGNDRIAGLMGNDRAIVNASEDGADQVNLGSGLDRVAVSLNQPGQVRLTFTSSEVGNRNGTDSDTMANQDGGLAVRFQREDESGAPTGPVSRYDDEGITFVAAEGVTFDVRDLVSGAARGDRFEVVQLGTFQGDVIDQTDERERYYINAGMGDDSVTGGQDDDFLVGGAGNDTLNGRFGDDSFIGGGGDDRIIGGMGDDTAIVNASTDGSDMVNLNEGDDVVLASLSAPGQIRLTFTSSEVGNGDARDSDTMANQDGDLAVRFQAEDGSDGLTGPESRYDDEGITFVANAPGVTFDVRDLVTGAQRGDDFEVVKLGTSAGDRINESGETRPYYINAGMGDDSVIGSDANDFLVGGAGNDRLRGELGDDTFIGGSGNDTIRGSEGADRFIFNAPLDPLTNVDRLIAFSVADDTILLDNLVFVGLPEGPLADEAFADFRDMAENDDRIVYNELTGDLFFDQNGGTREDAILFATIDPPRDGLSADDFVVI